MIKRKIGTLPTVEQQLVEQLTADPKFKDSNPATIHIVTKLWKTYKLTILLNN
jgi:hypothetical protein